MADLDLVQVLNTSKDLMEEAASLRVLQTSLFDNVVEEFATRCILHDQEKLLARLNDFIKLHDVGVSHYLEDMNLTHDSGYVRLVLDHVLLKDFDGYFLVSQLVDALSNFSESSFPNGLANHVVTHESTIDSFLAPLRRLPVTLFSLLILEISECLAQRCLQALALGHLRRLGCAIGRS